MDIVIGTIVGGKVILDHVPWDEGAAVTVIAKENRLDRWKYLVAVQIVTGSVTGGQVIVPDGDLMEGACVVVLATDVYARTLSTGARTTLAISVAEGDVSAEDLRDTLARYG